MDEDSPPRQAAAADELRPAGNAYVDRPLARLVSFDLVVVAHHRGRAEVGHRLLPSRSVIGGFGSVAMHGQQVRVFVDQRGAQLLFSRKHMHREADRIPAIVGDSGGRPELAPFYCRPSRDRKLAKEFLKVRFGYKLEPRSIDTLSHLNQTLPTLQILNLT